MTVQNFAAVRGFGNGHPGDAGDPGGAEWIAAHGLTTESTPTLAENAGGIGALAITALVLAFFLLKNKR